MSDEARGILFFLNEAASRSFRDTLENLKLIRCRLESVEGDAEGIRRMITRQCAKWKTDPKMCEYLRPATLFGKEKFSAYYDDRDLPVTQNEINRRPYGNGVERHRAELADNARIALSETQPIPPGWEP